MKSRIEELYDASVKIADVAVPIANDQGIDAAAIALVKVAIELLLKTHPKPEVVLWFRHQANLLETSDVTSDVGGNHAH